LSKKQQAELDETNAQYWQALGKFIEDFAGAEYAMSEVLRKYAGVSQHVGKAIFSGTKSDAAIKLIERIWAVHDPGETVKAELRSAFAQFRAINNVRNIAIHYGSHKRPEKGRFVSTLRNALTPDRVNEARVSSAILGQMSDDLFKISVHCWRRAFRLKPNRQDSGILRRAWRYKPPPNQNQSTKKSNRKDHD